MRAAVMASCLLAVAACGNQPPRTTVSQTAAAEPASSEPLPAALGIGRPATQAEIAREDIAIMPDGGGLPPGSGTVTAGETLYRARCVTCHGPAGEGTPAGPALVGRRPNDAFDFANSLKLENAKTIGNYWPYATTIFDYVRRAMPYDHPGSLSNDKVYALTAWLLWKNKIIGRNAVMDAKSLPAVRMPARDRFVRDDRESSTTVR